MLKSVAVISKILVIIVAYFNYIFLQLGVRRIKVTSRNNLFYFLFNTM